MLQSTSKVDINRSERILSRLRWNSIELRVAIACVPRENIGCCSCSVLRAQHRYAEYNSGYKHRLKLEWPLAVIQDWVGDPQRKIAAFFEFLRDLLNGGLTCCICCCA